MDGLALPHAAVASQEPAVEGGSPNGESWAPYDGVRTSMLSYFGLSIFK